MGKDGSCQLSVSVLRLEPNLRKAGPGTCGQTVPQLCRPKANVYTRGLGCTACDRVQDACAEDHPPTPGFTSRAGKTSPAPPEISESKSACGRLRAQA